MPVTEDRDDIVEQLESFRRELLAFCYRMLGSSFEAEDAVQETLVRAWSKFDGFEGRSALRTWLYRIATNVCLDMVPAAQRRARPMDLFSPGSATAPNLAQLEENVWVGPVPDERVPIGPAPEDLLQAGQRQQQPQARSDPVQHEIAAHAPSGRTQLPQVVEVGRRGPLDGGHVADHDRRVRPVRQQRGQLVAQKRPGAGTELAHVEHHGLHTDSDRLGAFDSSVRRPGARAA